MSTDLTVKEGNLKNLMTNKVKALQALLGDKDKANKFMAAALQVGLNKDLLQCTEESIINAMMGVAMLNLNIDKNVGHAYLIKYGEVATLQIGYKGWLYLLDVAGYEIRTFPVFECDEFDVSFDGWDYEFTMVPNFDKRDIGNFDWEFKNLAGVVVVSKDKSTGEFKRDFITKKTIEKARRKSPNQKKDAPEFIWKDWYIDMCCKSAVKKFKNQLVIRDGYIPLVNAIEANDSNVDYEKSIEKGVIIEADAKTIIESKLSNNINDIE